jgi:hypothetical protein
VKLLLFIAALFLAIWALALYSAIEFDNYHLEKMN